MILFKNKVVKVTPCDGAINKKTVQSLAELHFARLLICLDSVYTIVAD